MIAQPSNKTLAEWHMDLQTAGAEVGQDYCWGWNNSTMSAVFHDHVKETETILKLNE